MHWSASVAISVLMVLPAIWYLRQQIIDEEQYVITLPPPQPIIFQPSDASTTGRVANPGVFAADHGSFALDVKGDMRLVGGTLDITGDIRINGYSLKGILWAMINQGRAACAGIPCVHGVHDFLRTCICICEDGWTGQACDVFDCFGNGDWNTALQQCDCNIPFEQSTRCEFQLCRGVMMHTCPALLQSGCDTPGAFPEDECTEVCAAPQKCASRANWGRALLPSNGYMVGVCGGGFDNAGGVSIGAMRCPQSANASECVAIFRAEAPVCCSPGSQCGGPSCSNAACCSQLTSRASCLTLGCVWASGRVCMHPLVAKTSVDCELPAVPTTSGRWSRFFYGCTDRTCPQSAVERYVQTYIDACGTFESSPYENNTACLTEAFTAVNADAWPELLETSVPLTATFRLLLTNNSGLGQCVDRSGLLFLCERPIADLLAFTFVPAAASSPSQWQQSAASGYFISAERGHSEGGKLQCIVSSGLSPLLRMQLFPRDAIYLTSVDNGLCGIYVLSSALHDVFRSESGDETIAITSDGIAIWSSSVGSNITISLL